MILNVANSQTSVIPSSRNDGHTQLCTRQAFLVLPNCELKWIDTCCYWVRWDHNCCYRALLSFRASIPDDLIIPSGNRLDATFGISMLHDVTDDSQSDLLQSNCGLHDHSIETDHMKRNSIEHIVDDWLATCHFIVVALIYKRRRWFTWTVSSPLVIIDHNYHGDRMLVHPILTYHVAGHHEWSTVQVGEFDNKSLHNWIDLLSSSLIEYNKQITKNLISSL